MSLVTPTTEAIAANIKAQLEAALSQTIPLLPKAFTDVLAKSLAAVLVLVYRFAGFAFLQMFIRHASSEDTVVNGTTVNPLTEWGVLLGVGEPLGGTQAELTVDITVQNQVGQLDGGAHLLRTETGVGYQTLAPVILDAPVKSATIRATSDPDGDGGVGDIGNLQVNDIVTFVNPQPNVATDAVVTAVTVPGVDPEDPEVYRARVLDRAQAIPQGGAYADYRIWGSTVQGVANIYPYTGALPGEVDVYVEAITDLDPDGIPDAALLQAVFDAIELNDAGLASQRPANAAVNTIAITRTAFDVEISGLIAEDVSATQEAVEDGIVEHLLQREPFIVGLSVLPRLDRVQQSAIAGIVSEIVSAQGATVGPVVLKLATVEISATTLGTGEKAKLGTLLWI